jgi:hypothetical protein
MTQAITDDVLIAVRIASFYPLSDAARQEVSMAISKTMVDLGHKHNFIVYSASFESKPKHEEKDSWWEKNS